MGESLNHRRISDFIKAPRRFISGHWTAVQFVVSSKAIPAYEVGAAVFALEGIRVSMLFSYMSCETWAVFV